MKQATDVPEPRWPIRLDHLGRAFLTAEGAVCAYA